VRGLEGSSLEDGGSCWCSLAKGQQSMSLL
jgi:hypothetical protein